MHLRKMIFFYVNRLQISLYLKTLMRLKYFQIKLIINQRTFKLMHYKKYLVICFSIQRNTIQLVLITNGVYSFVVFSYDKITWTKSAQVKQTMLNAVRFINFD